MRYIELNPVRAGMVCDPGHYRWSSYASNGLGQANPLLTPHPIYLAMESSEAERQAAYRQLFRPELENDVIANIRLALSQSLPLGNDRFHAGIAQVMGESRMARPRGRPRKTTDIEAEPRQNDLFQEQ